MANDDFRDDDELERRVYRHNRRVRNQIIAYVSIFVVLAGLVVGSLFGVQQVMGALNDKKQAQELKEQLEELAEVDDPVVVEAPEETPSAEDEKSYLDEIVDACIAEMPIEDKVAGLFMITPEALTGTDKAIKAGDATKEKLNERAVGGLIYFKQNIKSADQFKEMIQNTKSWSKYPLFVGIDEEGGKVSRIAEAGLHENVGTMAEIGASGDLAKAGEAGTTIGAYLAEYGFNLDFAPVADVIAEGNTTIGDRSFGTDSAQVAEMAAAFAGGLQSSGVSACMKHFPGMGDTTEDAHEGMATSNKSMEDFTSIDFPIYQKGIENGVEFIMVSNESAPNVIGDNTPCAVSEKMITELLRGQLGFQGVVVTDSMSMKSITEYYTSEEAAVKALQAGADIILMPDDFEAAYNGVLAAIQDGRLTEDRINESLQRIYRVKYKDKVEE